LSNQRQYALLFWIALVLIAGFCLAQQGFFAEDKVRAVLIGFKKNVPISCPWNLVETPKKLVSLF